MLYGKYVENGTIPLDTPLKTCSSPTVRRAVAAKLEATIATPDHRAVRRVSPGLERRDYYAARRRGGRRRPAPTISTTTGTQRRRCRLRAADQTGHLRRRGNRPGPADSAWQDFDRKAQRKSGDPKRSQRMAYHMFFSVRDMARIGRSSLREGLGVGQQVAPRAWRRRSGRW